MAEFLLRRTLTRKQPKHSQIHQSVPVYFRTLALSFSVPRI